MNPANSEWPVKISETKNKRVFVTDTMTIMFDKDQKKVEIVWEALIAKGAQDEKFTLKLPYTRGQAPGSR
jgi:hypothetical protein